MPIVESTMLENLTGMKGRVLNGAVLIREYSILPTKNNKEYIAGTLQSGASISFKCWNNSDAFTKLKNEDYQNQVVNIFMEVDEYQGTYSMVVNDVTAVEGYTLDQFLPVKYNTEAYYSSLVDMCRKLLSEKAYGLLYKILFSNEEVRERFKIEFAAKGIHDACKSGLLAHTHKCLTFMNNILRLYPSLADQKDLLVMGVVLHDIGKIKELEIGVYQPESCVTHNLLGLEYIFPYKAEIVEAFGSDWYYNLLSIIQQHHNGLGGSQECKTMYSYIVHSVDMLDSRMTAFQDLKATAVDGKFKFDGKYYTI